MWVLPAVTHDHVRASGFFFSKLHWFFYGYFDPINIFFDNIFYFFWGDLSYISAKTATLVRASGVAILVFFLLEDCALFCVSVSRVIANGLCLARISFVSDMSIH